MKSKDSVDRLHDVFMRHLNKWFWPLQGFIWFTLLLLLYEWVPEVCFPIHVSALNCIHTDLYLANETKTVCMGRYCHVLENMFSCNLGELTFKCGLVQRFSKIEAGLPRRALNSFSGGSVNGSENILHYWKHNTEYSLNVCMIWLRGYSSFGDFYFFPTSPRVWY